jgi:hypothetical protein
MLPGRSDQILPIPGSLWNFADGDLPANRLDGRVGDLSLFEIQPPNGQ